MELIKDLRQIPLRELIKAPQHGLQFDDLEKLHQFHIVDNSKLSRRRHSLICESIWRFMQVYESSLVIIFDLDHSWNNRNSDLTTLLSNLTEKQKTRLVIVKDLPLLSDLIKRLRLIKNYDFFKDYDKKDESLGMLILDNISIYHWNSKYENTYPMELKALASLVTSIGTHFGCVIITSGLDREFETGVVVHKQSSDTAQLSQEMFPKNLIFQINNGSSKNTIQTKLIYPNRRQRSLEIERQLYNAN